MPDVILTAAAALPQVVLAVSRNNEDLKAFGASPGGWVYVVDSARQVCAGDLWDGAVNTPPPPPEPGPPVVPQLIEMGKAKLQMLDTPWPPEAPTTTLYAELMALADNDPALAIELTRPFLSRTRDKTLELQAYFGIDDATMDAMFIAADARP